MTVKELKNLVNSISSELDELEVYDLAGKPIKTVDCQALMIDTRYGPDHFNSNVWDIEVWQEYFVENKDKHIVLIF